MWFGGDYIPPEFPDKENLIRTPDRPRRGRGKMYSRRSREHG